MTIEKVKAIAKEKHGMDMTDDMARKYIDKYGKNGKLADDELDNVSGGYCGKDSEYWKGKYCEPCGVWCDHNSGPDHYSHESLICPVCGTIYS